MATSFDQFDDQDDVLTLPTNAADYEDEGSGATSGYGDTTEDDLADDDLDEEPLDADADEDLRGDDIGEDDL